MYLNVIHIDISTISRYNLVIRIKRIGNNVLQMNRKGVVCSMSEMNKTEGPRSVRWSDGTHQRTKDMAKAKGLSVEDFQKQLLSLYDRVSLETDPEFGSQISIVNELLIKLGDKFNGMVSHANDKLEIQEKKYKDHIELLSNSIEDYKTKVSGYEDQFSEFEKRAIEAEKNSSSIMESYEDLKTTSEERINRLNESIADKNKIIEESESKIKGKNEDIDELNNTIKEMKGKISKYNEVLEEKNIFEKTIIKYKTDMDELKRRHSDELKSKELEKREAVLSVREELSNQYNELLKQEIRARDELRDKFETEIAAIRKEYEDKLNYKEAEIKSIVDKNVVLENQVRELKNNKK